MSSRRLQRAMRLPGPPTCSFCGADDAALVLAGAKAFICAECVQDTTSETDALPSTGPCALCGRPLGSRYGLLWRRRRTLGLARGGRIACAACVHDARDAILWHHAHPMSAS